MTVSKYKIIQLLKNNPQGMKARQIARELNAEKKEVNSILYSSKLDFIRDDSYVWRLRNGSTPKRIEYKDIPEPRKVQETKPVRKQSSSTTGAIGVRPFVVAGVFYHPDEIKKVVGNWSFAEQATLRRPAVLQPEPSNKHDKNAIQVLVQDANGISHCVGYVPRQLTDMYSGYTEFYASAEIKENNDRISISVEIDTEKPKNKLVTEKVSLPASNPQRSVAVKNTYEKRASSNRTGILHTLANWMLIIFMVACFFLPVISKNNTTGAKANGSSSQKTHVAETEYQSRTYDVYASVDVISKNHVGSEWSTRDINVNVNGEDKGNKSVVLRPGDEITLSGCVVEGNEVNPDWTDFKSTTTFTIQKSDLRKGFKKTVTGIEVVENDGRYSGNVAVVDVIFNFAPQD